MIGRFPTRQTQGELWDQRWLGRHSIINGVVHIRTVLLAHATVPIGWVAVGDPVKILPPDQHDAIWAIQKPLDLPKYVHGVEDLPRAKLTCQKSLDAAPNRSPVTKLSQADTEGRRVSRIRNLVWQSLEGSPLEACPVRARII